MSDIKQPTFVFNMGDRVKDVVSGLEGVVIARFEYWTGCNHYGIEGPAKEGSRVGYESLDEQRLELIKANAVQLVRTYSDPASPDEAAPRSSVRPA